MRIKNKKNNKKNLAIVLSTMMLICSACGQANTADVQEKETDTAVEQETAAVQEKETDTAVEQEAAAVQEKETDTAVEEEAQDDAGDVSEAGEEELMEVGIGEVTIPCGSREIYGKLYTPEGEGKYPAIIMSHGYNGTNADFTNECKCYASHGFVAIAYDFCGGSSRSKSSGETKEMTITSEKEDLNAVFEYIKGLDNVDGDKMILFGASQGGFISSLVAADRADEVKALAMYFPALCIPDDWKRNYSDPEDAPETFDFWGLELSRDFVRDVHQIDVFSTIGNYKGDVLILHGDKDQVVPYSYAEKAQETYENCELIKMENEGHGFSGQGAKTAMEKVLEFIKNET